jgi:MFS family permease
MSAKRNLQLVAPYLICSLEGVTHGFYLLWVTAHRGIPTVAAAMAIAAGDFALLVLEVPTGIFADRLGAKRSLILGSISQLVGLALYWQARSMPALVAGVLAVALGDAFRHGADQALVYRSCAALGREEQFGRIFARAEAWAIGALVVLTALGGFLAEHVSFHLAFALDLVLAVVGLALACAMTELPGASEEPSDDQDGAPWLAGVHSRLPWAILAPVTIVGTLGYVAEVFTQTTRRPGVGADLVALAIAAAMSMEALGAALVARGAVPIRPWVLDAIAMGSAAAVGLSALSDALVPPALVVIFVGTGVGPAVRAALIQRRAQDGERATVASAASAIDMLGIAVGVPFAAWLRDRAAFPFTALVLGGVALVAWALACRRGRGR